MESKVLSHGMFRRTCMCYKISLTIKRHDFDAQDVECTRVQCQSIHHAAKSVLALQSAPPLSIIQCANMCAATADILHICHSSITCFPTEIRTEPKALIVLDAHQSYTPVDLENAED